MIGKIFDGVIIGAGPSGLATAIELAQGGWRVGLVERMPLPRAKICGGFIGPENKALLEKLGVFEQVRTVATSISHFSLHADAEHSIAVPLTENKEKRTGWGISRAAFDQILLHRARQLGVEVFDQCSSSVQEEPDAKVVSLRSPFFVEKIRTRYLVQATGASKDINEQAGVGAGALFEGCHCPEQVVSLYFVQGGHLGINRFENGRVNACYVVDHWLFEKLNKNMVAVFEHFLEQYPVLQEQFDPARRIGPFKGISVCRPTAACFTREGSFLVGDAVDVINPVIGGGNSLALASGMLLAQTLLKYPAAETSFKRLEHAYRRQWQKSFAGRVRASWVLGYLSHQHLLASSTIRLFKWHEEWLERLFQYSHRPLEFQL